MTADPNGRRRQEERNEEARLINQSFYRNHYHNHFPFPTLMAIYRYLFLCVSICLAAAVHTQEIAGMFRDSSQKIKEKVQETGRHVKTFFSTGRFTNDTLPLLNTAADTGDLKPAGENDSLWVVKVKERIGRLFNLPHVDARFLRQKGAKAINQLKPPTVLPDAKRITARSKKPGFTNETRRKPVRFNGGYLQYNLAYRSLVDTPFSETGLLQHFISGNAQVTLANQLPLTIQYIERESNSRYFKDFRDITVNVNVPELQRLRSQMVRNNGNAKIKQLEEQMTLPDVEQYRFRTNHLNALLQNPQLISLLIQSKENLINPEGLAPESKWKDSVAFYSQKVIDLYEEGDSLYKQWKRESDSAQQVTAAVQTQLLQLQKLVNGNPSAPEAIAQLSKALAEAGIKEERTKAFSPFLASVKKFSVGRTLPDLGELSVKNINVKGLNFEYNDDRWYMAATAGLIDFRIRDFNYGNYVSPKQFVIAAKAGLGQKNGTHIFITGYKGRKQLYFPNPVNPVPVAGAVLEAQYLFKKTHRLNAEIAQSSAPLSPTAKDSKLNFNDKSARAWQVQWSSSLPQIKAGLEASYQHTGLNFQSFNSYKVAASTERWYMGYDQYLLSRQLHIKVGLRKNDYENPLVQQRYKSNTVFKTVQATFKRKAWPSVMAGYIPSSQYSVVAGQVFESRYQTWLANINHAYKIGKASSVSNLAYTKFENTGSDSGFIYYNARNVAYYQYLRFALHTSTAFINYTRSPDYTLTVFGASASALFHHLFTVEAGFKINNLNNAFVKTGLSARASFNVKAIGDFALFYDGGYLPDSRKQLVKNDCLNISFTRYFK